jgi:hypothetical protein
MQAKASNRRDRTMERTTPQSRAIDVEFTVVGDIPPAEVEAARLALASLERYAERPVEAARLTLRRGGGGFSDREYVADASISSSCSSVTSAPRRTRRRAGRPPVPAQQHSGRRGGHRRGAAELVLKFEGGR